MQVIKLREPKVRTICISVLLVMLIIVTPVLQAYDCVLDEDGDGVGDGVSGASSGSSSTRFACGVNASAGGIESTALGVDATASGSLSTALGRGATASMNGTTAMGAGALATNVETTALGLDAHASGISSTALGAFTSAAGFSTAVGVSTSATGNDSTAMGFSALAAGNDSTAVGRQASAAGANSTAIGMISSATGGNSTALGESTVADGAGSISLGQDANIDGNSNDAIALGHDARIVNAAGGIAIGADINADGSGATATAPGAIAIGADVVADKANTMTVGVPIEIVRDDGSSNLLVEETNATVAVRTLGELRNNGGVRLRFNNTALGEEWDFTSNQSGGFQFSLVGSGGAELSVATNGTVRMGPGPISNLSLFPSGNMTIEGVLTENSDVNSKQQITELDHASILDKVSTLSIHEWEYKDSPDQRHIGPMAQDFYQAFNLGTDNTHIATLDMAGVALASIQALKIENQHIKVEKNQQIAQLQNQLDELKQLLTNSNLLNQAHNLAR